MYIPDVETIALNHRPAYESMIIAGEPKAFGRIVEMSPDKRIAYVFWRGTPGTYHFQPDATKSDTCYVVQGRAVIRTSDDEKIVLTAGSFYEFPRQPFDMTIVEEFLKFSVLYDPAGLTCSVEPL